ncbi:hypothetical protein QYH69_24225 [Paraburkholderia sp. SARCC-3016]|uniref:hypothetical protein n=1 Tax=Paraburkholderia sp. SARCC-3016 TaxID=3058611 RepID=UPI002808B866|nr:hypothetical protein [Paraburkholderia sp. SARCC-3016]MDQ7980349.1 hypothetical protein [Paraburkholderia sp. SARCC-3016]
MGIGLQIAYLGLPQTACLEAEAAVQLLRLLPYSTYISDCQLVIEHVDQRSGSSLYEVRLETRSAEHAVKRIARCVHDSAEAAIKCAFDKAVRVFEILSAHGKL